MEQRIRIVKASQDTYWYNDMIGSEFTVTGEIQDRWRVDTDTFTGYVNKQDAELLPTEPEEKTIVVPKVTKREHVLEQLVKAQKELIAVFEEWLSLSRNVTRDFMAVTKMNELPEKHRVAIEKIRELEQQLNKLNAK